MNSKNKLDNNEIRRQSPEHPPEQFPEHLSETTSEQFPEAGDAAQPSGAGIPPVFFWHEDEENGIFSNWYPRSFTVNGVEYLHVEQYMMARKALLFNDRETYQRIMGASSPKECKALGRRVSPFDSAVWNEHKFEIVKEGNRAKFEQHSDLKEALMATGEAVMAEASPLDKIWGIGIGARRAAVMEPSDWPGQNLLGKALMEIRFEFEH